MKLATFVRQCGHRMTESQFNYEHTIIDSVGYQYRHTGASWLCYPSSQQQRHGQINLRHFWYFVQWSAQNPEVFFRNAGLLKKGWWFAFLMKAKIENFKTWQWWGKMKFFWNVSISELKHISLSSTDLNVSLIDSYLSLWASRPIMGLNYIFVAAKVCFFFFPPSSIGFSNVHL